MQSLTLRIQGNQGLKNEGRRRPFATGLLVLDDLAEAVGEEGEATE